MQTAIRESSGFTLPNSFAQTIPGKVFLSLTATLIVAAAAHIAVPLWFTPVPLTLQPLAVLAVGLALGPVAGFFAMIAYLVEGALGMPVFTPTGPGGLLQLLGPTGGYLLAYPLVAFLAGSLTRGLQGRLGRMLAATIACAAAVLVLYVCGAAWLMHILHLSVRQAWIAGVAPFPEGEAIKIILAAGAYSTLGRYARR